MNWTVRLSLYHSSMMVDYSLELDIASFKLEINDHKLNLENDLSLTDEEKMESKINTDQSTPSPE